MVLQSNGNYHRVDPSSTGFYDSVFIGGFSGHFDVNSSTQLGIFHDMCHIDARYGTGVGYWGGSQHYPLIYHSKIYIKII